MSSSDQSGDPTDRAATPDGRRRFEIRSRISARGRTQSRSSVIESTNPVEREQAKVNRRYDRTARVYDLLDAPMELMGGRRRRMRLLSSASGSVLEIGVGTGKNLRHYPAGVSIVALDASDRMLARARRRAKSLGADVVLMEGDAHSLPFGDGSFDTTVGSSVLCSVADPAAVLAELVRVTRPGGRILLLEHVRPRNPFLGRLADAISVVTRPLFGFYANRRTEQLLGAAAVEVAAIRRSGVWREMELVSLSRPTGQDEEAV